jgi:hypothetical protein
VTWKSKLIKGLYAISVEGGEQICLNSLEGASNVEEEALLSVTMG